MLCLPRQHARLAPAMGPAKMAAVRDVASFPLRSFYARQTVQIGPGDAFQEEEEEEDALLAKAASSEMEILEAAENKDENDDETVIEEFDDYSFLEEDFGDF